MTSNKEECLKALSYFYEEVSIDECNTKLDDKNYQILEKLIGEHFDNPPLKFEELEVGMWVWDKSYKRFLNTGNKYVLCEDGKYHFAPFYDDFLCGNLYDFVNTDGFDDDGNEIGYEIIIKKHFENRFYRKHVEE